GRCDDKKLINKGLICPYCGGKSEHADSAIVYGFSAGMIYVCRPCGAWVGTFKGFPSVAIGRLANRELRETRRRAYEHFECLYKRGHMPKSQAYQWLAKQLRIPAKECHLGWFDLKQCQKVIEVSKKFLNK